MRRSQDVPRYRFERYLCTASEWRFHQVLKEAVGDRFDIMFQVRVAAVLRPQQGATWASAGRRVSQKAFDFVLVDKGTSRVRVAIELDDRTHGEPERQRRDQFLGAACVRAGLPLVRVDVQTEYRLEDVRRALDVATRRRAIPGRRKAHSSCGFRRKRTDSSGPLRGDAPISRWTKP